jgi:integrase
MTAPTISPSMTLLDYYDSVYKPQRLLDASEQCLRQYNTNLLRLDKLLGRKARLRDLTAENVSRIMAQLRDKGRSPETCNKVRAQLVALWRFAAQRHLLKEWPNVRKLVAYRRVPTSWTAEEFASILESSAKARRKVAGVPAPLFWRALLLTIYDTGARVGALIRVCWEHVNLEQSTLLIPAELQKCRQDQLFKLHSQTVAAMSVIRQPERATVFPGSYATLHWRYNRILRVAGLPHTRRDKFHKIRRTHATLLAANVGIEAASWSLGHANQSMTREHYIDTTKLPQANVSDKLPRPETTPVVVTSLDDPPNARQVVILCALRDRTNKQDVGAAVHRAMFGDVPMVDNLRAQRSAAITKLVGRGWVERRGGRPWITLLGLDVLAAVESAGAA